TRSDRDWSSDVCSSDLDRADAVTELTAAVRDQAQAFGVAYDAALAQVRPIVRALEAPAAPEVAHHAPSRTPLFAAVTTFVHSVEIGRASCRERVYGSVV